MRYFTMISVDFLKIVIYPISKKYIDILLKRNEIISFAFYRAFHVFCLYWTTMSGSCLFVGSNLEKC